MNIAAHDILKTKQYVIRGVAAPLISDEPKTVNTKCLSYMIL